MDSKVFEGLCRQAILDYYKENYPTEVENIENIYVVWSCKTLQNNKALLSTNISDKMYFEITHNGDKNEIYVDAYKKVENKMIVVKELM